MSLSPAVKEFIASKVASPDETVRRYYQAMKDLYEKKLWHQLTLKVAEFVKLPQFDKGTELVQLYDRFIRDFESKVNQLELAKIAVSIVRQITDPNEKIHFLQRISEKINADFEKESYAYILAEIAWIHLSIDKLEETRALADKIGGILDAIAGADPLVYSTYYRVLSLYYKTKVAPSEFYRNSLLYLVYTPLEQIPPAEQLALAFDMGLAALVAHDIHNFGELLAHPILNSLAGSKHAWLKDFLFAFNSGDLARYEQYLSQFNSQIEQQPALHNNRNLLREKISILALMELVFNRPSEGRTLPFNVIATATRLREDEVELLIMKSLSVKLIRGEIDEVNKTVTITWVQPRVLDMKQIAKMRDHVAEWTEEVQSVLNFVQNETAPELLA